MSNWINNFASVQQPLMMNTTNIDQLFLKKEEDVNIIKMLELKGEIISLLDGRDEFDLLEDEKKELESVSADKNIKLEIKEMKDKIKEYIEKFNKIQKELYICNDNYQKEVNILRKNIMTTESMIEFIKKIPDDQKNQENVKKIIDEMNILSKSILNNDKMKKIRKDYLEKRKEAEYLIEFIKQLNNLNQTNLCPVCFSNTVDHFSDPCGHTFCKDCIKKHIRKNEEIDLYEVGRNDGAQCCFCRERIRSIRPLYFL
jgi:hypothetical protein